MAKLHELLAAEKTPAAAWNQLYEDTMKKFKNPQHYFEGHSKSLKMIDDSPQNESIERQAREEKPVTTTVYDTLQYALEYYGKLEDIQYQKNKTNSQAVGTVLINGQPFLVNMPVDQLLGLEARLLRIRKLYEAIPTLDATRHWTFSEQDGAWQGKHPEETTKTEKSIVPIKMAEATKEHPEQVHLVNKDVVVGRFTLVRRSGAATAFQKAEALRVIDDLLVEVKRARMRANETEVENGEISTALIQALLAPLK